jgi:hypothetical protein
MNNHNGGKSAENLRYLLPQTGRTTADTFALNHHHIFICPAGSRDAGTPLRAPAPVPCPCCRGRRPGWQQQDLPRVWVRGVNRASEIGAASRVCVGGVGGEPAPAAPSPASGPRRWLSAPAPAFGLAPPPEPLAAAACPNTAITSHLPKGCCIWFNIYFINLRDKPLDTSIIRY